MTSDITDNVPANIIVFKGNKENVSITVAEWLVIHYNYPSGISASSPIMLFAKQN